MAASPGADKGPGRKRLRVCSSDETSRIEALIAEVCKHGLSENQISLLMGRQDSWLRGVLRQARLMGRAIARARGDDPEQAQDAIAIEHRVTILEFIARFAYTSTGPDVRTAGDLTRATRESERAQLRAAVRAAREFQAAMKLQGDDRLAALAKIQPFPAYPVHNRELAKIARLAAGELVKMRMCYSPADLRIESRFKNPMLYQSEEPMPARQGEPPRLPLVNLQPPIDRGTVAGIVRSSRRLRCVRWARSGPAVARMASYEPVHLWTYDGPSAHLSRIIRH